MLKPQLTGAIAGAAATLPMTAVMVGIHKTLPPHQQEPIPPRQITETAAAEAGVNHQLSEDDRKAATTLAHFGYGAAAGAAYGAVAGKTGLPPVADGALYGLAVWGGSYLGLLPATGLYRSAKDEPAGRNFMMIAAHIVWGGALGAIYDAFSPRQDNYRDL